MGVCQSGEALHLWGIKILAGVGLRDPHKELYLSFPFFQTSGLLHTSTSGSEKTFKTSLKLIRDQTLSKKGVTKISTSSTVQIDTDYRCDIERQILRNSPPSLRK